MHAWTRSAGGSRLPSKGSRTKCAPLEHACLKLKTQRMQKFAPQANAELVERLKKQNVRSERQHGGPKSLKQRQRENGMKLMSVLLERLSPVWQVEMEVQP